MRFQVWTLCLAVICKYIFILLCLCVREVNAKVPVVSLSKQRNPYCLSTGWFQGRIRAGFHNCTSIHLYKPTPIVIWQIGTYVK